jgi:4-carboxymuconolactone decarboxylase
MLLKTIRMKPIKMFLFVTLFALCFTKDINAQQTMDKNQSLDLKQQSIVAISAFTAKGDMIELKKALNNGLDAGLSINEIKEIIVQLYAYTGFPRSLNALNAFMNVIKERKQQGIKDELGKEPNPLPANKTKLQLGTELQTKLVGQPVKGEVYEFAPAIDQFLKEHLFGAIFGRDNLDWKTREIATIAALAALGGAENQLRSHMRVGLYNGLTQMQVDHIVSMATPRESNTLIFPKGEKITNNNFTGDAWLQQMISSDSLNPTQVGTVTFAPGARSNWHMHPAGQILLILDGTGYYQEKGSAKKIIKKGDFIKCPPGVPHWHGASKDDHLIQTAITNSHKGATVWLEKVTDEEYHK